MSERQTPIPVFVGCAGWSIPREWAPVFDQVDSKATHLERYARRFSAVEINSSFYRAHRPATYRRWADSVPADFRFAVKVPRQITHFGRLAGDVALLEAFLTEATALGDKLGSLLVQLPPTLAFTPDTVSAFFDALRARWHGFVVCEPRHASWFLPDAERLLIHHRVARAAVDPAPVPAAAQPGGWAGLVYYRLHGSPEIYYSEYDDAYLAELAQKLTTSAASAPTWCIFDNTAQGAATKNALCLRERL